MKLHLILPCIALFGACFAEAVAKVACVGDSISFGSGLGANDLRYPQVLAQLLGDQFEVKNFGNPGKTAGDFPSQKSIGRWYGDTKEYKDSLDYKADIYICNLGINDTGAWWNPQQFEAGFEALNKGWKQANPKAKLYAWGLLGPDFRGQQNKKAFPGNVFAPEFQFSTRDNGSAANREAAEKLIEKVYRPYGGAFLLLDAYSSPSTHPEWYKDGLHPTAPGAKRIAEITFAKLASTLHIPMPTPKMKADAKSVTISNPGKMAILLDYWSLVSPKTKECYSFRDSTVIPPQGEISISLDPDAEKDENNPTREFIYMTKAKGTDLKLRPAPKGAGRTNGFPILRRSDDKETHTYPPILLYLPIFNTRQL